jgi:hypothetical protein
MSWKNGKPGQFAAFDAAGNPVCIDPREHQIDLLLIRCQELESALRAFVAHAESRQRPDQHNPYTARELWPDLFAASDRALMTSAATTSASQPAPGAR